MPHLNELLTADLRRNIAATRALIADPGTSAPRCRAAVKRLAEMVELLRELGG